eukprot:gene29453-35551_t
MESDEIVDIAALLEQELDDLEDDDVQEDIQLPQLLFQQQENSEDDDFLSTMNLLKSEADVLFSSAWTSRSEHADVISTPFQADPHAKENEEIEQADQSGVYEAHAEDYGYSQEIDGDIADTTSDSSLPVPHQATNILENPDSACVESPSSAQERRMVVGEVLGLMIDSVEALALIFLPPAPPTTLALPVPALPCHSIIHDIIEEASSPPVFIVPETRPQEALDRQLQLLLQQEKETKRFLQKQENEDELKLKQLHDQERERLARYEQERKARARKREELEQAFRRERAARAAQRTWRGHVARTCVRHRREVYAMEREELWGRSAWRELDSALARERHDMQTEHSLSLSLRQLPAFRPREMISARDEPEIGQAQPSTAGCAADVAPISAPTSVVAVGFSGDQGVAEAPYAVASAAAVQTTSAPRAPSPPGALPPPSSRPQPRNSKPAHVPSAAGLAPQGVNWGGSFSTAAWAGTVQHELAEQQKESTSASPAPVYNTFSQEQERQQELGEQEEEGFGIDEDRYVFEDVSDCGDDDVQSVSSLNPVRHLPSSSSMPVKESAHFSAPSPFLAPLPVADLSRAMLPSLPALSRLACPPWPGDEQPVGQVSGGQERAKRDLWEAYEVWRAGYDEMTQGASEEGREIDGHAKNSQQSSVDLGRGGSEEDGSAQEVDYSVEELHDIDFILQRFGTDIRKLTLNVNQLSSLSGITSLPSLTSLSVVDNQLTSLNELARLPLLAQINADNNRITDLSSLSNHAAVQILSVNCNNLQHFPLLNCPRLLKLELYKNRIADVPAAQRNARKASGSNFVSLLSSSVPSTTWHLPRLLYLNLGRNQLKQIDGHSLSSCVYLQTLILSQNLLTSVPSPLRLPCLSALWLNGNQIENLTLWEQSNSASSGDEKYPLFLPSLQKLYLQDNRMSSLSFSVFAYMPLVNELDISFNQFSSLEHFYDYADAHFPYLSSCKVNDNPFTTGRQNNANANANSATNSTNPVTNAFPVAFSSSTSATYFSAPVLQVVQYTHMLQHSVTFNDWQTFFLLLCPQLTMLSNIEVTTRMKANLVSVNRPTSVRSKKENQLLQMLGQMKVEMDLVQNKLKKRQLKQKKDQDGNTQSNSSSVQELKEELMCNVAKWQCSRLARLSSLPEDSGVHTVHAMLLFSDQSSLLPSLVTETHKPQVKPKAPAITAKTVKGMIRMQSVTRGMLVRKKVKRLFADI